MKKPLQSREQVIRAWVQRVAASHKSDDDLHVNDIDECWSERSTWLRAGTESLSLGSTLCTENAPDRIIGLGASLREDYIATPRTYAEAFGQIDWSPPSLYLFGTGQEPWASATLDVRDLATDELLHSQLTVAKLISWRDMESGEMRRSIFLIVKP